ncbi:hypothetical protein RQP46_006738 [Phenoliferia psychrophenolica]
MTAGRRTAYTKTPSNGQPSLKRTSSYAGLSPDVDLTSAKRQLSTTMHELSELRHTHERHLLESSSNAATLQSQLDDTLQRLERLERQRALLVAKERDADEREKRGRAEADAARSEQQVQLRKARSEANALREEKEELERAERRARCEAELERSRQSQTDVANAEVVKEELHRQVGHLRTLEKDNGKLRRSLDTFEKQHANLEVLKEANKSLEKKVISFDALRQSSATLAAEVESLKREKREWQSFLGSSSGSEFSSPHDLTKSLAALQIANASLLDKTHSLELEIHHRDHIVGELEARVTALQSDLATTKALLGKSDARAKQEGNRQKLVQQEIAMLKRHLATYETESAAASRKDGPPSPSASDAQKTAQINELEHLLEAHKSELAKLAKDVAHYQGLVERYGGSTTEIHDLEGNSSVSEDDTGVIVARTLQSELAKNEALQAEILELRNENALMDKEIEALDLQVQRLMYEDGQGAYNPRTTKVLELAQNPDRDEHAIRSETLKRLKEENEALLVSLAMVQQRGEGPSMVPRQSLENARKEVENAEAIVKQKETMELRVKQAFADKANEFRAAVVSLLGFRLDFLSSGRVKVTSVYNPGKEYALLFSSAAGHVGTMELIGAANPKDELADEVKGIIKYWGDKGCIPGLLATLSLTLFDKTQ